MAALLTAIGGLVSALSGAFAVVWTTVRTSRREREDAAPTVLSELADAAADGEITAEELDAIARALRERHDDGGE
ncbi:hypothetical protein [Actinokineospora sp. UTMC 2448]|uniref:hypothetical protein n=1 Tax=Actinokineospora sp. UTMC 2448 TaxID=2268449 RepID=UPI002164C2BF|nr:hypothetical protein [Actinokineospora sp. UTMC 2448]